MDVMVNRVWGLGIEDNRQLTGIAIDDQKSLIPHSLRFLIPVPDHQFSISILSPHFSDSAG